MNTKRPIDLARDQGGQADVGTAEDGAIIHMEKIGEQFLIIKERSVYELKMADDIDPERKNPNLPPTSQRLVVNFGTESEIFSRTFLTARQLFKTSYLTSTIDMSQAILLTLEIVQEIAVLDEETKKYISAENNAIAEYNDRKEKKLDHAVPSIPDIKTRCKTIFHKADQAYQALLALIRIFYPDFNKQSYYSSFMEFIKTKYGEEDPFTKFLQEVLSYIMLARNIRNCLDHRRTEAEIKNFEIQLDGSIIAPTIEVHHLESNLARMSLSQFLPSVTENLVSIVETMIVLLASRNLKNNRLMPGEFRFIPEEKRLNKNIRFAYWSPIGDGGYFVQT